jgi:hypothetical protein
MSAFRTRSTALLTGLALFAAACDNPAQSGGGSQNPGPIPQVPADTGVATLELAPDTMTLLAVGGHRMVQATARDGRGHVLQGRWISYTSSDVTVATVDASGNVTGHNAGRAWITAAVEGKTAQARVDVIPLTVDSLVFGSAWLELHADVVRSVGLTLLAADGRVLYDYPVTWSSSDTTVAQVDNVGRIRGVAGGRAWVTAESGGVEARLEVIVPVIKEMHVTSVNGNPLSGIVWDQVIADGQGNVRRVRVEVVSGTLSFHTRDRTYQQRVATRVYERQGTCTPGGDCIWRMDESVQERVWTDHGNVTRNQFTGEPIFHSTATAGLIYYAQNASADGLTVWQVVPGTQAILPYLYHL